MKWRIGDLAVAGLVLLLAAAIWIYPSLSSGGERLTVEISQNGEVAARGALSEMEEVVELSGCTVEVSGGSVRMLDSDCDDRVCVLTGAISSAGSSIICVPNRVVVEISGDGGFDVMAG